MIPWFAVAPAETAEYVCVSFAPVAEDLTSTDFCCRSDGTEAWMVDGAEVATWTEG